MDMRNTVDIMCFGIMMAFEYVDETSVLKSLDSSTSKAYRLTSMINSCNIYGYLDADRTRDLGLGLGAIVVMIDCLVADVKSGDFLED